MKGKFKSKDLADKLGVSGTLVSLVLNNKADQHGIRKETQEKVLAMARQMGFFSSQENDTPALPVEEKPGVIAMVVPPVNDPFLTGILPYLQNAFANLGLGFSIITKDPDDQRFDRLINAFKRFFSGMVLVGNAADDNTIRSLRTADYPFILLENCLNHLRMNVINSDWEQGTDIVVKHIAALGYKNILLATDNKSVKSDKDVIGLLESKLTAKYINSQSLVFYSHKKELPDEIDFSVLEKYMRPPVRTDAIIIMHAAMVYPLLDYLQKGKIRVPQDIAVISMEEGIGFDLICPAVTSLKKPLSLMATKTANMIWTEIKNAGKSKYKRQVNITPELIIRNSCGSLKN